MRRLSGPAHAGFIVGGDPDANDHDHDSIVLETRATSGRPLSDDDAGGDD
jgi:hypothetical protein